MQKQKTIQNGVNGTTTKAWVLNALCTGRWQNNCAEKYNTQLHVKIKIKLTQAWDHSKTNKYGCCMTILQQLPQSRNKKNISTVLCTGTIREWLILFSSVFRKQLTSLARNGNQQLGTINGQNLTCFRGQFGALKLTESILAYRTFEAATLRIQMILASKTQLLFEHYQLDDHLLADSSEANLPVNAYIRVSKSAQSDTLLQVNRLFTYGMIKISFNSCTLLSCFKWQHLISSYHYYVINIKCCPAYRIRCNHSPIHVAQALYSTVHSKWKYSQF